MKDYEAIIAAQQVEIERLKNQLKEVYSINAREASLEAKIIRDDLSKSFTALYNDFSEYFTADYNENNYESLQAILTKVFRILAKNQISFK